MTPSDIEVLLHYHCSPEPHPRIDAPAVREVTKRFLKDGIIKKADRRLPIPDFYKEISLTDSYEEISLNSYITTEKGTAWVKMICETPYPKMVYVDPRKQKDHG